MPPFSNWAMASQSSGFNCHYRKWGLSLVLNSGWNNLNLALRATTPWFAASCSGILCGECSLQQNFFCLHPLSIPYMCFPNSQTYSLLRFNHVQAEASKTRARSLCVQAWPRKWLRLCLLLLQMLMLMTFSFEDMSVAHKKLQLHFLHGVQGTWLTRVWCSCFFSALQPHAEKRR